MRIAEVLLADFEAEISNTRRTLERVPDDKPDYKPHEKSMPLGKLAGDVQAKLIGSDLLEAGRIRDRRVDPGQMLLGHPEAAVLDLHAQPAGDHVAFHPHRRVRGREHGGVLD